MIMESIKSCRALILCSILHLWSLTTIITAQDGTFHRCSTETTFTPNSRYQTNLQSLLSSLASNSTRENGFYSLTVGNNTPDVTSGLFLCRGDVNNKNCSECVRDLASVVAQRCPDRKSAIITSNDCTLSYWNQSYDSSTLHTEPNIRHFNTHSIAEPVRFRQLVLNTMINLASRAAASNLPAKKFATEEVNFSTYQTIYCLAQCTPDLSNWHCGECLTGAYIYTQIASAGGRVIHPSCTIRFDLYPFYSVNESANPTPDAGSSPLPKENNQVSTATIVAIVLPVAVVLVLVAVGFCFFVRNKARKTYDSLPEEVGDDITDRASLQFDLETIKTATNNFTVENKIGEGGFGVVYWGVLPNRQEIAVKRLARSSGQGATEFKNEIVLVAKLQHRNLVRLLGFCLDGQEKLLVYEFVPNKSLDYFLFDPEKQGQLTWERRYKIIQGIARGLVYLHEESQLRIIHRDLKASNILLDEDMTAKISDFGMARIFGVDQTQANTRRVVGTFGYMSPEYINYGQYSIKLDVYSFGVLILEIISGKKCTGFQQTDGTEDLLSYAWKHWCQETPLEFMDPILRNSYSRNNVIRCIHLGLLCVQENPADRPTMQSIVLMLSGSSITMPLPQQPGYSFGHGIKLQQKETTAFGYDDTASKSINEMSVTEVYPR